MAALPRSRKLLCSGREEASRLKEAQVRHRFVVTTLVSPTPGETKKWGSLSLCQLRKRWASPPKDLALQLPSHIPMLFFRASAANLTPISFAILKTQLPALARFARAPGPLPFLASVS